LNQSDGKKKLAVICENRPENIRSTLNIFYNSLIFVPLQRKTNNDCFGVEKLQIHFHGRKKALMNRLVGEKLSIITAKAQTTRHRIIGIVNKPDYQVVYSDTPGVLRPNYKLQEQMLNFSLSALDDADVLLYVTDVVEKIDKNDDFLARVQQLDMPVLLLINKIDLTSQTELEKMVERWHLLLPKAEIYPISASNNFEVDRVEQRILELLPESPPYFEKDALTDKPARFFVTEIIREKALLLYQKEVPYSIEVVVEEFKDEQDLLRIRAIILVERDSQKGIVIGHKGESLKKLGTMARKDIEHFFEKKVFLELYVKVEKDWRNRDNMLKAFGYKLDS
jgi:GTP-binding protein Era